MKRVLFLLVTCMMVTSVVWFNGETIARQLLPLYGWTFSVLTDNYKVETLRLERINTQPVIKIKIVTLGKRQLGFYQVPAGQGLSSSTLVAHVLQSVILFLTFLIVWPTTRWQEKTRLLLISVPVLILILMLDVPFVLLGALEDLVYANYYPEGLRSSLSIRWMDLMNGGGRLALAIAGAVLVVLVERNILLFPKNRKCRRQKNR